MKKVSIETKKSEIVLELFEKDAPNTVSNFVKLTNQELCNGLTFHRVIPNFVTGRMSEKGRHRRTQIYCKG